VVVIALRVKFLTYICEVLSSSFIVKVEGICVLRVIVLLVFVDSALVEVV
jgi:hypothetical protein